jgi:hypothetical protein
MIAQVPVAIARISSSLLREHVGRRPWRILPRGTIARAGTATRPRNGDGG